MKNRKICYDIVQGTKRIRNMFLEGILLITILAFSIPYSNAEVISTPCGNFTPATDLGSVSFTDTYTNNLTVNASDVCAMYSGTGGTLTNLNIDTNAPNCPDPIKKAAGSNVVWIDWGTPCVRSGDSVTVKFQANTGDFLERILLIWTLNGTAIPNQTQQDEKIYRDPPPPVPQNLGMYDTSIYFLITNATDQSVCRQCHQTTGTNISGGYNNTIGGVPTRHHNLLPEGLINPYTNTTFGCQDCHPSTPGGNGILLDRSCMDCHNGTNFWADSSLGGHVGNISVPHHFNTTYDDAKIGNPAPDRQCKFCHGSFVDNYNDSHYIPSYNTSFMITPYATFKITNFLQTNPIPVFDSYGNQVFNKTWGGCESCHLGESLDEWLRRLKLRSVVPNFNTHHNVTPPGPGQPGWNATSQCWCHVTNNASPLRLNITNPFSGENLTNAMEFRNSTIEQEDAAIGAFEPGTTNVSVNGTGCEKCHSVRSLHNIQFNYSQNGPQGFGHINNNSDCYGCHNSWLPADTWTPGALIPTLYSVRPSVITAGTATTLSITGANFVNNVTNPDGTLTSYTSVVTIDGTPYTPKSITDTDIVVDIPTLSAGVHQLQLVKGGDTLSKLSTLTVINNPTITSAVLSPGKNGQAGTITITGNGFGTKPTNATMYVSVNHAGNQIISSIVSKWTDTQIMAKNSAAVSGDVLTVLTNNAGEATQIIQ